MYLVIGRKNCSYCNLAKELLESRNISYVYKDITTGDNVEDAVWKNFLVNELEVRTLPQIFNLTGGYTELFSEIMPELDPSNGSVSVD
jgi:glutaredoxin